MLPFLHRRLDPAFTVSGRRCLWQLTPIVQRVPVRLDPPDDARPARHPYAKVSLGVNVGSRTGDNTGVLAATD